ncbi:hypothetical protein BH09BAC3_BH09BAC3_20200 [soil metagenome]
MTGERMGAIFRIIKKSRNTFFGNPPVYSSGAVPKFGNNRDPA